MSGDSYLYNTFFFFEWQVRTKEDRKKSPVQEEARVLVGRERSKSDGRGSSGSAVVEGGRTKLASGQQGDDSRSQAVVGGGKGTAVRTSKFHSSFLQTRIAAAGNRVTHMRHELCKTYLLCIRS
jgi:hypothetical protein